MRADMHELAGWFFTVRATRRCRRCKIDGRFDGVVPGGVYWCSRHG
jgi:hypothetical protein